MAAEDGDQRARLDAEHARRLLAMLVTTSGRLAPIIDDWHTAVGKVSDDIVPDHADIFAIDVIDIETGSPEQVLWRATQRTAPPPSWREVVEAVIATGAPCLYPEVAPIRQGGSPTPAIFATAAGELHLSSLVVAPVTTRGLTLGTLAVGTADPRRGLRLSDVEVYRELAARLAVTIERVILHREARAATRLAEENARRLGRAAEAAPAIAASLDLEDVAAEAAAQVARVLDLPAALCAVDRTGNMAVTAQWPSTAGNGVIADLRGAGEAARRDGRPARLGRSVLATPLTDKGGNSVGYLAVGGDEGHDFTPEEESVLAVLGSATAAAAAHARLFSQTRANETRLRTAIDASPVAIIELAADGAVVDSNPASAAMFGWPVSGPRGRSLDADVLGPLLALRAELVAGTEVVDREATFPSDAAQPLVVQVSAALVGRRGAEDPALFLLLDVTQRLRLEREVQQGRRMESLGRLAGGVAHDFNNLLTIITGYGDILHRRLGDAHPQIESVEAIQAAARRAATFTGQLLTISRSRVGRAAIVDVNPVLGELMEVLPRLLTAEVVLVVEPAPGQLWVEIEAVQLEQILLNLVVNARDAMPDGGTLTIRTSAVPSSPPSVVITVGDSGTGMDAATAEHCFEPFFSGPDRPKGTGLGLATVHGIVEQAGGRISFETAPNEGTTFSIVLPSVEAPIAAPAGAPEPARAMSHPVGRAVLLVEDDPQIRTLANQVLTDAGYVVHPASTAEDALEVAELLEDRVDVLVTDIVMPGSGGADLAAVLSERVPGLRVVFMSGFVDDERRQRLVRAQPYSTFLSKPFGPDQLVRALSAAVHAGLGQGSKR